MIEAFEIGVSLALQDGVSDSILRAQRDVAALQAAVRSSDVSIQALRAAGIKAASVGGGAGKPTQVQRTDMPDAIQAPAREDSPSGQIGPDEAAQDGALLQQTALDRGDVRAVGAPEAGEPPQLIETGARGWAVGQASRHENRDTGAGPGEIGAVARTEPQLRMPATSLPAESPLPVADRTSTPAAPAGSGPPVDMPAGAAAIASGGDRLDQVSVASDRQERFLPGQGDSPATRVFYLHQMSGLEPDSMISDGEQASEFGAPNVGWAAVPQPDPILPPNTAVGTREAAERGAGMTLHTTLRTATGRAMNAHYSAAPAGSDRRQEPFRGDVYLDGMLVGRWMSKFLRREAERADSGPTGFDAKRSRLLPGVTVGG